MSNKSEIIKNLFSSIDMDNLGVVDSLANAALNGQGVIKVPSWKASRPTWDKQEVRNAIADVEQVFPSKGLLDKIIAVESQYGQHPHTYRPATREHREYTGGPAQVDYAGFKDTQNVAAHPGLRDKYKQIKDAFGIDWQQVQYKDLVDPKKSALAGRLLLSNDPNPIPDTLEEQAQYWKDAYNKSGKGTPEKFLQRWQELSAK